MAILNDNRPPQPYSNLSIEIVTAMTEQHGLADAGNGRALWEIPKDLKNFRNITRGYHMAIGGQTFKSMRALGHPTFTNRINMVVGDTDGIRVPVDHLPVKDIDSAVRIAERQDAYKLFLVGGAQFYKQAFERVNKLHITTVHGEFETSETFPGFEDDFHVVEEYDADDNGYEYTFRTYTRNDH